jgi:hypothetical protein
VKKVSKEEYKEMLEKARESKLNGEDEGTPKRTPKEKIDAAW